MEPNCSTFSHFTLTLMIEIKLSLLLFYVKGDVEPTIQKCVALLFFYSVCWVVLELQPTGFRCAFCLLSLLMFSSYEADSAEI